MKIWICTSSDFYLTDHLQITFEKKKCFTIIFIFFILFFFFLFTLFVSYKAQKSIVFGILSQLLNSKQSFLYFIRKTVDTSHE
jgi:hypothetical protein